MAIGLKDIKNPKKDRRESNFDQKQKVLRPWEDYDSLGIQTRTVTAQEAVKRARLIVQRNEEMVENLKKNSYKPRHQVLLVQKVSLFNKFLLFLKGLVK